MDTNIILSATDANNKKVTKTLPDINPNADTAALRNFAQGLNDLTTNDYVGSVRVTKINLDEDGDDTPTTPKLPRNPYMTHVVNSHEQTITGAIFTDDISGVPEDGLGFTVEDVIWEIDYQGDRITTCNTITDSQSGNAFFDTGFSPPVASASSNKIYFGLMKVGNIGLEDGQTATFTIHADESSTYEALDFVVTIQGGNG